MRRDDLDPARGIITAAGWGAIIWIVILLLLSGCEHVTPYTALDHMSDPKVSDDGYTWACAGLKTKHRLSVTGGYCWDVRGNWNVAEARVEYEWSE